MSLDSTTGNTSLGGGWLYISVATKTRTVPNKKFLYIKHKTINNFCVRRHKEQNRKRSHMQMPNYAFMSMKWCQGHREWCYHTRTYQEGFKSCRTKKDTTEESIMEREEAKPLRMLSAYFITTATMMPPSA